MTNIYIEDILQWADDLIFDKTGEHLTPIQKVIITGTYQRQKYRQIAQSYNNCSESHIKKEASILWQILGEELGYDITKYSLITRFKESLQNKKSISDVSNLGDFLLQIDNINIGGQLIQTKNDKHTKSHDEYLRSLSSQTLINDLTLAPQIIKFYNRETELKTLNNYIFNQKIKLISVLGLSGIGKTYLVKRFVDLNLDQFEVIIWKNLKLTNDLTQIITEILSKNLHDQDSQIYISNQIDQFLNLLKTKRCLIIFDHVEELFIKEKLAGQFQDQFKNYQDLFNLIKEIDHQSHFILISDEKSKSMISLNQEVSNVKILELEGLNNSEILNDFNLQDQESWLNLIQLYQGNFNYLKDIVTLIDDVFGGKVKDFLALNQLILTEDMKSNLSQLFKRLSPIETEIMLKLSQNNELISTEELTENLTLELIDLINGLQSLQQRYLVTKIEQEPLLFKIDAIFQQFLLKNSKVGVC